MRAPTVVGVDARRRIGLCISAALVSFSALAGAVGLATGDLDTPGKIDRRLPFHSPVFGSVALALVVGLPMGAVARAAWRRADHLDTMTRSAGALLVAWIVVELAFIRELSWLQPLYVAVGATFIAFASPWNRRHGASSSRLGG